LQKRLPKTVIAALLAVHSASVMAHGEGYLLAGAAGLALAFGAVIGLFAGLQAPRVRPPFSLAFALFLAIGGVASWISAGSSEGLALFLVFGGIGGVAPLAIGYFSARATFVWLRGIVAKHSARVRAKA